MMKKNSAKNTWLKAAMALAFLGGAAIPTAGYALTPERQGSTVHYYRGAFDWSVASNFDTRINANRSSLPYATPVDLKFKDDNFYAYNVSTGRKKLTQFYHAAMEGHTIIGENAWATLSREVKDIELTQNAVKLYNQRSHKISYEQIRTSEHDADHMTYYDFDVYYTVEDASRSHLSFEDEGITWKMGDALVSLDEKFDFGKNGLTVDLNTLKIKNPGDIVAWTTMDLIRDGNYDYTTFYDKMKPSMFNGKKYEYSANPSASIAVSGVLGMAIGIGQTNGKNVLTLAAQDNRLQTVDIDLAKIGNGGDAWNTETPLYTGPKSNTSAFLYTKQNFSVNPLTVTVKDGALAGGTTDASIKAGTTMTLVKLDGTNTDQITTKYGTETITGEKTLAAANFSDVSSGGVAVTGTHQDKLRVETSSGKTDYALKYTVGNKTITGVTSSASGIDLSKTDGGFIADSGYILGGNITLDLGTTTLINTAKAGNYTLLDLSAAQGSGTLSVKGETGEAGTSATITGDEYTATEATNGVTAIGTKDITFTANGKKIDVSVAANPNISKIKLGAYDVTKTAQTIGNLGSAGTIDASGLSIGGMTLQEAANSTGALTLASAAGVNTFSGWTGYPTDERAYTVYDGGNGITAMLAGTINTDGGNINLATNGLKSVNYKEIDWSTSATPAVALNGGKLGGVDVSNMYTWQILLKTGTETMHLLDAKNLSSGNISVTAPSSWNHYTKTVGDTTVNTYHSPITKKNESVSAAGMTLSLKRADQIIATETKTAENKYDFSMDITTNKGIATGFSVGKGITWTNGGAGLVLSEDYDFSALADGAIKFDATDPYKLISNPDEVGTGDTMTFFNAGSHMSDIDWASKVAVISGSAKTYSAQERAVTIEGSVALDLTKDDANKKVTGTISDEYLSSVAIDLSKIGTEKTAEKDQWVNGGTLYSQTESTQDYGTKKTTISVSGTTDESVKADEFMTLVHIEGTNAGVAGNITVFNETRSVDFSDTAANGIVATGTHTDTLQSTVKSANDAADLTKGSYDLTYTVGKKYVTGITATNLDLTKDAFTAGDQYTLGTAGLTIDVDNLVIGDTGNVTTKTKIIDFTGDTDGYIFQLKAGSGAEGSSATSAIAYAETDADAVNGIKISGNQNRTFSTTGKVVYLDSVTKDVNKVTVGAVDLSQDIRTIDNLAETGTIDANGASYSYSELKKISDVAGQTITVVGATGTNKFNNGNWTDLPTTTTISVTQETGIGADVKAAYTTEDGNINLKTSGLNSVTFGQNIAWSTSDTVAVALSGKDVGTVDFSAISFADSEIKKNETMHLLNAQNMSNTTFGINAPTTGWTMADDGNGTIKYNKDGRMHIDEDNLTGAGITLAVDRGDQIVGTTTTANGKTNYTLDYTRGKGYVTGMTIADSGITWENGKTAITLDEDYDFSVAGTLTFPADKISNVSTLKAGDAMTLFDANGRMTDADWTNVIQIDPASKTISDYTSQATKAVTITGNIDLDLAKDDTKKITATVSDQNMNTIAIDLSKIGEAGDDTDAWSAGTKLYENESSAQDYAAKKVTVSVDATKQIFGGTTDESVKKGDQMLLLDITGKNAGTDGNISAIDTTSAVAFKDKQENGLTVTGTHTDTIKSIATPSNGTDGTGKYELTYIVGQKELNADSSISAAELDVTKDAFTAGDQYTLSGNVTVDVRNIEIKNSGDGTKKAIIDFTDDSGSGTFSVKDDNESGSSATNVVSYTEETETNGILAAGNQTRTFSADGKVVYLDSVTQDVNKVTVGQVDFAKDIRSFDNLAEDGTVSTIDNVILDNLSLTKDEGTNFTLAKASGANTFSKWTLPDGEKDIYARQETGVVGIMKGQYNIEDGNLKVEMKGIESIYFTEGVKWREGSPVLDLAGSGVDLTGKIVDASGISFDKDSVNDLVKTDGAYRMVLIHSDDNNHLDAAKLTNADNISMTVADAVTFKGKTALSADGKQLIAEMNRSTAEASGFAHHHVMAQAAALKAVSTGNIDTTDQVAGALSQFRADEEGGRTMVFAHIGGSSTETKTGSHISSYMWNVDVGLGSRKEFSNGGRTEYALYYEGGRGNYSTHYANDTADETSGKLKYHGAGFLFRYESPASVYGEAGLHAGRIKNENDALGMDNSASYYGFHVGVGKLLRTNEKDSFDIYTKFYYNRTGSMAYSKTGQDDMRVDAAASKLLRIGGRYHHLVGERYTLYAGAAFAYEFGGNANGTAGLAAGDFASIRPAGMKGAGAVLEFGFRQNAQKGSPWEIDLGLKGYMGRQKGIGGNIGFKYHF